MTEVSAVATNQTSPAACPACANLPRAGAHFCDKCGYPLGIDATVSSSAGDKAALQRVLHALAGGLELASTLEEVAQASIGIAGAECCTIDRWLPQTQEFVVIAESSSADWTEGDVEPGFRYFLSDNPTLLPVFDGHIVRQEPTDPILSAHERQEFLDWGVGSALFVPIMVNQRLVGMLELFSRKQDAFPPRRVAACAELAAYAAIGFERGAAYDRDKKLAARLGAVAEAATRVVKELDLDRLLNEIPDTIRDTLGYDLVNVFMIDKANGETILRASAGFPGDPPIGSRMPAGAGIIGRTAITGTHYVADDVASDPFYVPGPALNAIRSEIAAPIVGYERILGVLDVQSYQAAAFDETDAVALDALAAELGVAFENARLFERIRADDYQLRAVMESAPNPLTIYDARGRVMLVNERMRELFQFDQEVIGMTFAEAVTLAPPSVQATVARVVDDDSGFPESAEVELNFTDPSRIFIRRVTPVTAGDSTIAHVVVYQDVTKERAALRAKDQLLSIAAHELRTPLTAMLGFGDLVKAQLEHDVIDREAVNRRMTTIQREARRLAKLVEQLLGLAQLESGASPLELALVDLGELTMRVMERFDFSPETSGRLRLVQEEPEITGMWDDNRLDQILTNLVDNALKYSPENSPVEIVIHRPHETEACIEVHDHGTGLTSDELGHLFRPFSRLGADRSRGSGLGLGLYVSRTLAERHGGKLWLDSQPNGEGVSAHLSLPIHPESSVI
jgi:signal transduction histidine kinase